MKKCSTQPRDAPVAAFLGISQRAARYRVFLVRKKPFAPNGFVGPLQGTNHNLSFPYGSAGDCRHLAHPGLDQISPSGK